MKFDFSKSSGDLQNKFQYIYSRLDNLLAMNRYQIELILAIIKRSKMENNLQKQVDEYFEDDSETSPQTDSEEQNGD